MSDAQIPGKTSSGSASSREQFRATEAIHEALRVAPTLRVVEIESWAQFPLRVLTPVQSVVGVLPIACFEVSNEGATIAFGNVQWAHGDEPGEIEILQLDGLTSGTQYLIRLLVIGAGS